uniref:Uncharacterized protein n=1 Tax=Oryza glaberrima TaxID=4538 RepID=I1QU53_ORYGL
MTLTRVGGTEANRCTKIPVSDRREGRSGDETSRRQTRRPVVKTWTPINGGVTNQPCRRGHQSVADEVSRR